MFGKLRTEPLKTGLHRELMLLRELHYPGNRKHHPERYEDSEWGSDDGDQYIFLPRPEHREPYPDYAESLIGIMRMVQSLIHIQESLKNNDALTYWKQKVASV